MIEHWHRSGNWTQQWTTVRNVVELLVRLHADEPAAALEAAVASRTTSAPAFGAAAARLDQDRAVLRQRLGPTYQAAVARGDGLSDDEVVALARGVIAQITAHPVPQERSPGP